MRVLSHTMYVHNYQLAYMVFNTCIHSFTARKTLHQSNKHLTKLWSYHSRKMCNSRKKYNQAMYTSLRFNHVTAPYTNTQPYVYCTSFMYWCNRFIAFKLYRFSMLCMQVVCKYCASIHPAERYLQMYTCIRLSVSPMMCELYKRQTILNF